MRYLSWTLTITLTALTVSGLFVYKEALSAESANAQQYEPSVAIKVERPQSINFQETRIVSGTIKPKNHLVIKNELSGKIAEVNVASGDVVRQGQILLVVEHAEEKAKLAAAEAKKSLAQLTLTRYQALAKDDRISKDEVDSATSNLAVTKAEIAQIKSVIARKTLRAPFDAFVGIHDLKVGEYLDADAEVVELVGTEREVWVDFYVPQTYPILPTNSTVNVRLIGEHQPEREAQIVTRAKQLSAGSRQLHYRASLMIEQDELMANQLVRVTVPVTQPTPNLVVPALSIVRDQSGDYVYLIDADQNGTFRAAKQKVVVESINRKQAVVSQGLAMNALVATEGAFKLYPGVKAQFDEAEITEE